MTIDTRTATGDGTRFAAQWTGVVLGPAAALVALELGYVLAERACASGQTIPLHLSFVACLLVALGSALVGWREWRAWVARPAGEDGGREGRSRFLALLGILSGGVFGLTVVAMWSGTLFYHPCQ